MRIDTKYNIEDKVWFMHDNKLKSDTIIKINVVIEKDMNRSGAYKTTLYGLFNYSGYYTEEKLFPTKEELIKSL